MNYLAHCALADYSDKVLLGSLLGDAWRGRAEQLGDVRLRIGLLLHRRLDSYTDQHPVFQRSRARLAAPFRRYAGILVDVFYDHFLAREWAVFRADPAERFAQRVYDLMAANEHWLPAKLQRFGGYMRERQLLTGYADEAVIAEVLKGLSGRLTRSNPIAEAITELRRNGDGLRRDLFCFYPEAVHASRVLYRQLLDQLPNESED